MWTTLTCIPGEKEPKSRGDETSAPSSPGAAGAAAEAARCSARASNRGSAIPQPPLSQKTGRSATDLREVKNKGSGEEKRKPPQPPPPPSLPAARLKDGGEGAPLARGPTGRKFERRRRAMAAMAEEPTEDGAARTLPSLRRLSRALPFGRLHGRLGISPSGRLIVPASCSQVRRGRGDGAAALPCPLSGAVPLSTRGKSGL